MILSQLQIHLAAEGAVGDVITLVTGIMDNLTTEQGEADRSHNEDVNICEHELTTTMAKHQKHVADRDTCLATVSDTETLLSEAESELEQTIINSNSLDEMLEAGRQLREEQAAAYELVKETAEEQGIAPLTEAIRLISNLANGGSFI